MTTAIIGTGGLGSVIARQLASGGETLRLSSADTASARTLAAQIGRAAVVVVGNRDALQGVDAVVLALRFTVLKGVIDQIAGPLTGKLVIVPSNPVSTDAHGNVSRVLRPGTAAAAGRAGAGPGLFSRSASLCRCAGVSGGAAWASSLIQASMPLPEWGAACPLWS
jgi:predicted dinucleotide-binding enzyme